MAKNPKEEEILDWTVSEQGFEEPETALMDAAPAPETSTGPKHRLPPLRLPRWWPLFLAVPAVLVLVAVWAGQLWQTARLRQEIGAVLAQNQQPPFAPLSLLRYRPTVVSLTNSAPPHLLAVETLGLNRVRTRVAYTFFAPDGHGYEFTLPRTYERTEAGWAAVTETEDLTQLKLENFKGTHFSLIYFEADAELMTGTLGPYLETVLNQACASWQCKGSLSLNFTQNASIVGHESGPPITASPSLLFQLISVQDYGIVGQLPSFKSPHYTGTPLTAASTDYWKKIIALQAVLEMAYAHARITEETQVRDNPYFYALVAQQAAKLGIEAESVLTFTDVSLEEQLSLLHQDSNARSLRRIDQPSLLAALALLNRFAQEFPQTQTGTLLQLSTIVGFGPTLDIWLMRSALTAPTTLADFVQRWYRFLGQEALPPTLPAASAELALGCLGGPQFLDQGQVYALLPNQQPPIMSIPFGGWSPNGRYLALGLSYTPSVLEVETGNLVVARHMAEDAFSIPLAWAGETVLAYISFTADDLQENNIPNFQLKFMDAADPRREFPESADSLTLFFSFGPSYAPSPDRTRAFVLRPNAFADQLSNLDLLFTAIGGPPTRIANNVFYPTWSPDSHALAYAAWDEDAATLNAYVYDVLNGQRQLVWSGQSWMPELEQFGNLRATFTWSPNRRWIALAVSATTEWLGLVAPDGSGAERLELGLGPIQAMAFSPNGRYLAVISTRPEQQLVIVEVASKQIVQKFPGTWNGPLEWAPDGSRLLVFGGDGAYLLTNPSGEDGEASEITTLTLSGNCGYGMWKPK